MDFTAYTMEYAPLWTGEPGITCVPMEEKYFPEYRAMYNACFYDIRYALGIQPYNVLESFEQLGDKLPDIRLLFDGGRLVGSVACYGHEIDDLVVHPAFRRRGYGRALLLWAMHNIRKSTSDPITLHVAEWNGGAVSLYKSMGFEITEIHRIERN